MAEREIKKILEKQKEEITRHFDVVAERIEDKIKIVSEQVGENTEKITVLQEQAGENTQKITLLQEDMNKVKDTLEIIKLDIEFIKNELKQKVGRDEFAALEKRVSLLEAKINRIK